jgi:hypothetical protein
VIDVNTVTAIQTLDSRARLLRAAVGLALVPPTEPGLLLLHRWLDSWRGVGDIVAGMARQGYDLELGMLRSGRAARGCECPRVNTDSRLGDDRRHVESDRGGDPDDTASSLNLAGGRDLGPRGSARLRGVRGVVVLRRTPGLRACVSVSTEGEGQAGHRKLTGPQVRASRGIRRFEFTFSVGPTLWTPLAARA